MRVTVAGALGACLALSVPIGSASAATAWPSAVQADRPGLIQADWNGGSGWHHHWRHEWRHHWRPAWHPYWHHHWHHGWGHPYGRY
jgi:hypothetical protein